VCVRCFLLFCFCFVCSERKERIVEQIAGHVSVSVHRWLVTNGAIGFTIDTIIFSFPVAHADPPHNIVLLFVPGDSFSWMCWSSKVCATKPTNKTDAVYAFKRRRFFDPAFLPPCCRPP